MSNKRGYFLEVTGLLFWILIFPVIISYWVYGSGNSGIWFTVISFILVIVFELMAINIAESLGNRSNR